MLSVNELVAQVKGIDRDELDAWVAEGWVRPVRRASRIVYRDVDVARVRLIIEIRDDLNVRPENIPLVLSLIDQVHGLRNELRALASAVDAQSEEVRRQIRRHMERSARIVGGSRRS
jgi:chaperone modulatory protein CbpM